MLIAVERFKRGVAALRAHGPGLRDALIASTVAGARAGRRLASMARRWALGAWERSAPAALALRDTCAAGLSRWSSGGVEGAVPEDPLGHWQFIARRTFVTVVAFSIFVNLLMLTLPIYLFQISDRVLTSHSLDTLLMLSLLALVLLTVLSLLDIFRRQVLGGLAISLETILGGPLLASVINASPAGASNIQALRSLHHVRNFISSPAMLLLFDAPIAPLYFAAVFLVSPQLGVITLAAGVILAVIALINQRATSEQLALATRARGAGRTRKPRRSHAIRRSSTPWGC